MKSIKLLLLIFCSIITIVGCKKENDSDPLPQSDAYPPIIWYLRIVKFKQPEYKNHVLAYPDLVNNRDKNPTAIYLQKSKSQNVSWIFDYDDSKNVKIFNTPDMVYLNEKDYLNITNTKNSDQLIRYCNFSICDSVKVGIPESIVNDNPWIELGNGYFVSEWYRDTHPEEKCILLQETWADVSKQRENWIKTLSAEYEYEKAYYLYKKQLTESSIIDSEPFDEIHKVTVSDICRYMQTSSFLGEHGPLHGLYYPIGLSILYKSTYWDMYSTEFNKCVKLLKQIISENRLEDFLNEVNIYKKELEEERQWCIEHPDECDDNVRYY